MCRECHFRLHNELGYPEYSNGQFNGYFWSTEYNTQSIQGKTNDRIIISDGMDVKKRAMRVKYMYASISSSLGSLILVLSTSASGLIMA